MKISAGGQSACVKLGPADYFLTRDNRGHSLDSRAFGPVVLARILDKTTTVLDHD